MYCTIHKHTQVPDAAQRRACVQFCVVLLAAVLPRWQALSAHPAEAEMRVTLAKQEVAAIFGSAAVDKFCLGAVTGQQLLDAGNVAAAHAHMEELVSSALLSMGGGAM